MIIEALVRWTEIRPKEQIELGELDKLLRDPDDISQQIPQVEVKYDYSPMCFDLDDVAKFNRANVDDLTVLRFYDGDTFVVKIPYFKFRDLFSEYRGLTVVSTVPDTKPEQKGKRKKDDDIGDLGI